MYKSREGQAFGVWNHEAKTWEPLAAGDYANWINEGIRVAKKQSAPQLIRVPIPQPGGAS